MINTSARHYIPNLKLAVPVISSHAGQMLVGLVDTLMVGRVGAVSLAAASFANNVFINILVFGMGISIALTPLVGKAHGGGRFKKCAFWLTQSFYTNLFVAIILTLVGLSLTFLMPYMGQDEKVCQEAIPYFVVLAVSLFPQQMFNHYRQFSEGVGNTKLPMLITLCANVINVFINYLLIFGNMGLPALGLLGAAIGTLVSRLFMLLAMLVLYKKLKFFQKYQLEKPILISVKAIRKIFSLGVPIGLQFVIEVFAFSIGSIMVGWIGANSLAAHQIVITIASLTFMMSNGLGAATTIRVSMYRGRRDFLEVKNVAFASIHMVIMFMSVTCCAFLLLRQFLPSLFIDNQEVIVVASALMLVAGLFQIFDGMQVVMLGILRGMEDVWVPLVIAAVVYLLITIPVCYMVAFKLSYNFV